MGKQLTYRIKSRIDSIYPVEQAILNEAALAGFNEDACFSLRLAIDEAVVNAIIHGNGQQETKQIHITAAFDESKVAITVRDEGEGFDQSRLADPRQDPDLHKTHGRGVFLIRQFTSEVFFNEKGNEITFIVDQSAPANLAQLA